MSDSGEGKARRGAQAASVTNRWWENGPGAPPPPPPLSAAPLPAGAIEPAHALARRDNTLELELEAARAEVAALHEMLEDLPEIFERKFRQRVQGLVEEQQRLLHDNQMLRERLYALTPATPTARIASERVGLRRTVREVFGSLRSGRVGPAQASSALSRRDGGRTTAA
jgi:hypothetical protein